MYVYTLQGASECGGGRIHACLCCRVHLQEHDDGLFVCLFVAKCVCAERSKYLLFRVRAENEASIYFFV